MLPLRGNEKEENPKELQREERKTKMRRAIKNKEHLKKERQEELTMQQKLMQLSSEKRKGGSKYNNIAVRDNELKTSVIQTISLPSS